MTCRATARAARKSSLDMNVGSGMRGWKVRSKGVLGMGMGFERAMRWLWGVVARSSSGLFCHWLLLLAMCFSAACVGVELAGTGVERGTLSVWKEMCNDGWLPGELYTTSFL